MGIFPYPKHQLASHGGENEELAKRKLIVTSQAEAAEVLYLGGAYRPCNRAIPKSDQLFLLKTLYLPHFDLVRP